jgi:AcrR family transcriptional regulator
MEQVAAAADIAKGTLYKYFPVKDALLAHQFQRDIAAGMKPLWQVLAQQHSFAAQMKCLLHASAKWNEARRIYIPYYIRHQFSTSNFDCSDGARQRRPSAERRMFERLCIAGQTRGDVRSDLSAAHLAVMLECMWLGATMIWLATPGAKLKAEFDALMVVALNGVG